MYTYRKNYDVIIATLFYYVILRIRLNLGRLYMPKETQRPTIKSRIKRTEEENDHEFVTDEHPLDAGIPLSVVDMSLP